MKKALKGWLVFGIVMTILILASCVTEQSRENERIASEYEVALITIKEQGSIIKQQEVKIAEDALLLKDTVDSLQLIMTFREAGLDVDITDVRAFLDLVATLPYGSPLSGAYRVTSEYGMRSIKRYGWIDQKHLGIDLVPTNGDWDALASVDGYISDWGWSDLYGNYIEMTTVSGYRIFYAHLDKIFFPHHDENGNWFIDPEQVVKQGTRLGIVGQTGTYATGPHLHYEIWIMDGENGYKPLDPEEILKYQFGG